MSTIPHTLEADARFIALEAETAALENGTLQPAATANTETSTTNAGALSTTKLVSLISSAGAETRTLAAPTVAQDGQMKIVKMSVDGGTVTVLAANIDAYTTEDATFDDVNDSMVLIACGLKWRVVGGNVAIA